MTKQDKAEILEAMYEKHDYRCFVCGKSAIQRAHIIGNTHMNRRLYNVVDNPLNWLPACSLYCNAKIDVGYNDELKERISLVIESEDMDETEKREAIEAMVKENIQRKEAKLDS